MNHAPATRDLSEPRAHDVDRALLDFVLEFSTDAVTCISTDGKVIAWSKRAEELFGYSGAEMLGRNVDDVFPLFAAPDVIAVEKQRLARAAAGEDIRPYESTRKHRDGSTLHLLLSAHPIRNARGEIIAVARVSRDITERKAHAQDKALLAQIVDSSSDAIISYDLTGTITSWNRAAEKIYGHPAAEMVGTSLRTRLPEFVSPERAEEELSLNERVAAGEYIAPFEAVRTRKDGTLVNVLVSLSPVRDAGGNIIGTSRTVHDISERKAHEAQRTLLSSIVEHSNDAIYTKTLDGRITSWNPAAETLFGYTADEIVGQSVMRLFGPENAVEEAEILERIRAGESIRHYETARVAKNGTRIDVSVTVSPMLDPDGQIVGVSNIVRDISESKRAAEVLTMQADLLRLSFDAIIVWRFDGAIEYWNTGAQALYGYTGSEALGRVTHELLSTGYPKPWAEIRADLIGKGSWEGELRHRKRDGGEVTVSGRLQLVRDAKGIARVIEINRDITERKQYEARLKTMQEDLFHVGRLNELGQVSAGIAHELNQPLAALLNYTNLAKRLLAKVDVAAAQKASEAVTKASEQAMRAGEIIRRMRSFVEKRHSNRTPEDINAVVKDTLALGFMGVDAANVATHLELAPYLPRVLADRVQIQQVLVNLLHNAVDAMVDSRRREITIRTALLQDYTVEVTVEDTGPGIPKENAARLFMPFFTTKPGGMGIGLVISRSIIEAHGGKIGLRSADGGGTAVHFTLPTMQT